MKKKGLNIEIWENLIIPLILLVVIIFFLILVLFLELNNPQFTITKEECHNETFFALEQYYIEDGNYTLEELEVIKFSLVDSPQRYREITKKVCGDFEVEFMLLPYTDNCIGMNCPEEEDLSIKWLDENCELPFVYENTPEDIYFYPCGEYKVEVKE